MLCWCKSTFTCYDCYVRSSVCFSVFFFQAEDGIRDLVRSRGLGDVYKRQSPGFVSPDFIYPDRIDSLYVRFHSQQNFPDSLPDELTDIPVEHYNPASLEVAYSEFNVTMRTGGQLRGWYVAAEDTPANTILSLIHISEPTRPY